MTDNRDAAAGFREPIRNQMIERINTDALATMGAMDGSGNALRTNFLPSSFTECMELAKLMAAGTFVPTRVRGKPGDCLAIILQATRWGMDPFAVAQKVYFVNNDGIPGYEAQLVVAVINTSGALEEKLSVEWEGEGENLKVIVSGKLKGDRNVKTIEQPLKTITIRNSPLWKQSPRQQLGYYGQRLWARLYAPEVMLGVYAADELNGADGEAARRIEATPAPTREQVRAQAEPRVIQSEGTRTAAQPEQAKATVLEPDRDEGLDAETEEQRERRIDAEAERQRSGDEGDEQHDEDLDDTIPHMDGNRDDNMDGDRTPTVGANDGALPPETAKVEPAAEAKPVEQAKQVEQAKPTEQTKPAMDWDAWINKLARDFAKCVTPSDVNALYASKAKKLTEAAVGTRNRAEGLKNAQLTKLGVKVEAETTDKSAADASADDDRHPAEVKADAIIAELKGKEILMDLRSCYNGYQADLDAMDEATADRVTAVFRSLEDAKVKAARK